LFEMVCVRTVPPPWYPLPSCWIQQSSFMELQYGRELRSMCLYASIVTHWDIECSVLRYGFMLYFGPVLQHTLHLSTFLLVLRVAVYALWMKCTQNRRRGNTVREIGSSEVKGADRNIISMTDPTLWQMVWSHESILKWTQPVFIMSDFYCLCNV
jgi:hypothetical protein